MKKINEYIKRLTKSLEEVNQAIEASVCTKQIARLNKMALELTYAITNTSKPYRFG